MVRRFLAWQFLFVALASAADIGCATNAVAAEPAALPKTVAKLRAGEPVKFVCFGDSVTGLYYHTGGLRAYTDMLGIALRRALPKADLEMINAGVSGDTTTKGLARIERDVLAHQPTLVTVMFGLNDLTTMPREQYAKNLVSIIEQCRAAGAEVLLATPNNVINTGGRPTDKLIEFCDAMRAVGRELKVPVSDVYRGLDALRERDARAWRLVLSDEIHPNMDGHKRMAEILAQSISGQKISLDDVPPPEPTLPKTRALLKEGKSVNILAMPPLDELIGPALKSITPDAQLAITPWVVEGKSLAEISADAKARIRAAKPDLVVVAVPRTAKVASEESLIWEFTWIMNWSLAFGRQEWDCVVVHPAVTDPRPNQAAPDVLIRQLVRAQDLHLIDRSPKDRRPAGEILMEWVK